MVAGTRNPRQFTLPPIGRSRKPLCGYPHRGFESHPLRQRSSVSNAPTALIVIYPTADPHPRKRVRIAVHGGNVPQPSAPVLAAARECRSLLLSPSRLFRAATLRKTLACFRKTAYDLRKAVMKTARSDKPCGSFSAV